jgi:hypothetical protein
VDTAALDLRLTDESRLENGSVILTYTPKVSLRQANNWP